MAKAETGHLEPITDPDYERVVDDMAATEIQYTDCDYCGRSFRTDMWEPEHKPQFCDREACQDQADWLEEQGWPF